MACAYLLLCQRILRCHTVVRQNIDFARLLSRARARGVLRRCLLLRAILLGEGVCALGEGVCALFMIEDHLFIQSSCTLLERLHLLEALAAHSAEDPRAHHASMGVVRGDCEEAGA